MRDTLYYDGRCPLCAREIKLLRKLSNSSLELQDIHDLQNDEPQQPTKLEMLSILHLRDTNGAWVTGLDATKQAWDHTAYGWIFAPLRWPMIRGVADWAYNKWALRRACDLGYSSR